MNFDLVVSKLQNARRYAEGKVRATCPCHQRGAEAGRTLSLSVSQFDSGGVGVYCHAGCAVEDVIAALGLSMVDLFPDSTKLQAGRGGKSEGASWMSVISQLDALDKAVADLMIAAADSDRDKLFDAGFSVFLHTDTAKKLAKQALRTAATNNNNNKRG